MRSTYINNSIKDNIIVLKKKVKTSGNLHAYYKILLKEKLDLFHYHVNQQRYKQTKPKLTQNSCYREYKKTKECD